MFTSEVQFGHAGSCANSDRETATAKNAALKEAGAFVPSSFDTLGVEIHEVYLRLVNDGTIVPAPEVPPPTVPMDYSWARVSTMAALNEPIASKPAPKPTLFVLLVSRNWVSLGNQHHS